MSNSFPPGASHAALLYSNCLPTVPSLQVFSLKFRILAELRAMRLRIMTKQDIPAGLRLNTLSGWNQTAVDWDRFLANSPRGCFVMEDDTQVVGTAATISYENRFAWIGMVLVDPEYQKQ